VKNKPLTPRVLARFAAVHLFSAEEAQEYVRAMTHVQRKNLTALYATDELLDADQRMLATTIEMRLKYGAQPEKRSRDLDWEPDWSTCPFQRGSREANDWAAEQFNKLGGKKRHRALKGETR
jgi:hypothetical protein